MKKLFFILLFMAVAMPVLGQTYRHPTHYHGIFSDQPPSARAQGMGMSMITLNGVANSIYNPATISPDTVQVDFQFNYTKGHPFRPVSHYPFVGLSYKVFPRLTVAGTLFTWRNADPVWTTQIGAKDFDANGLVTQSIYSLTAAYQVIAHLHVGVAGNFLKENGIKGETTNRDFILSLGAIYDREMTVLKHENLMNQKIRVAGSFINLLGNSVTEQKYEDRLNYRDLPVYLRLGTSYSFAIPIEASFTEGKRFFDTAPRQLDFSVHLHMQDHLKTSDSIHDTHTIGSAVGFGTEVQFLKTLYFRLGYYSEKRGGDGEISSGTDPRKSGITWGYGALIPLRRLTDSKVPFDAEINFVTGNLMDELNPNISHPSVFNDDQFLFGVGINLKM